MPGIEHITEHHMNTGQVLLTIGALALLSYTTLNLNRNMGTNDEYLAQNRYRLEALSIMTSHLEQVTQHYFDEASTDTVTKKGLADMTVPHKLGMDIDDAGLIDDIDDYNGHSVVDTGRSGIEYHIDFKVDYVQLTSGVLVTSPNREYHKRIRISLADNYVDPMLYHYEGNKKVKDTLNIEFVQSYWFYN